jgi:hypothetical protein
MSDRAKNIVSKEAIITRMFRQAAQTWGYKDTDLNNFDPLVRLLIEACALELYRIDNEMASADGQMLEKLARLLTPEVYTAPKASHAIAHGRPVEAESRVYPDMQLYCQKKVASRPNGPLDSNLDIFFSPAGHFRVVDGDIKYMGAAGELYQFNNSLYKEGFAKASGGKRLASRNVWLGVELNHQIRDLSGLGFFFDLRNYAQKWQLLKLLPYSKWRINGAPVTTVKGLLDIPAAGDDPNPFSAFDEFDINKTLLRKVNRSYQDHFVSLVQPPGTEHKLMKYPPEFDAIFSATDLKKLQKDLLWISIEFLPEFDETVLNDLTVSINCFPVANRRLNEIRYRLQTSINIIPFQTQEQFLAVGRVESDDASEGQIGYSDQPVGTGELRTKGMYSLRSGDIERFDARNATEYLHYLVELLRDESGAFAALGQDFVASLVRELNQNINQLDQKLKQNQTGIGQDQTYLLINPRQDGETIFVSYWTTVGQAGNSIRSTTRLDQYSGSDLQAESVVLMTNSDGGADRLRDTEVLNAYKNTLITRGRIVTAEDARSFCHLQLGDKIRKVSVSKGVAISKIPNEGLINTIDLRLTPAGAGMGAEEWPNILHDLAVRLEEQSALTVNYRISLDTVAL